MKQCFFSKFMMGILVILHQTVQGISPEQAAIATGITTLGIATTTYIILKNQCKKMSTLEQCGLSVAIAAPISYIISTLWYGLTPEMRYIFGKTTAESNEVCLYASKEYQSIEQLLEDVEDEYSSYKWLVDLHDDMVRSLTQTRLALKKWIQAQKEDSVAQASWVDATTYDQLQRQKACLEHNVLLLRRYQPFQQQHSAWITTHTTHCSCRW